MIRRTVVLLALTVLSAACASSRNDIPTTMGERDAAAVVIAANEGEIQQGQLATTKASSPAVREFAQTMVTDHTAALQRGRDVFSAAGITPLESETSRTLTQNATTSLTTLGSYSGDAFDRQYMQLQIDQHQWLLNTMDLQLIPASRSKQVESLLRDQRRSVADHLEHARAIMQGMNR